MIIAKLRNRNKYHTINTKEGGVSSHISHFGRIFVKGERDVLKNDVPSVDIFALHKKGEVCERCMNIRLLN